MERADVQWLSGPRMEKDLPEEVLHQLADCRTPLLIGVRHHSAALARVMPQLLADFSPEAVLVEMPPDFQPWLEYLGRSDLQAPVALAACDEPLEAVLAGARQAFRPEAGCMARVDEVRRCP